MVLFSKEQLLSISDYLEAKYVNKEVTSVEIVITLLAMKESGKLNEDGIAFVLLRVFKTSEKAHAALDEASLFVSDDFIKEVLANLK